jgi:hypothetical protein
MAEKLDFEKQYEEGLPTFEKLFKLSSQELKEKIKEICGSNVSNEYLFTESSHVVKTIKNDKPKEIVIEFYDSISISPFGISYQPEHGSGRKLVTFNKFFVLA